MTIDVPYWLVGVFMLLEAGLAIRRHTSTRGGGEADAGSLRLLWITISTSITAAFVLAHHGPHLLPGFPWTAAGVVAFAIGTTIRWWSILHLGRFFTVDVAVADDHRVINTGPYRLVRHPSYLGLLLQLAGLGATLLSLPSVLLITLPPTLALLRRISIEEKVLRAQLPVAYAAYRLRTRQRLVPFVY